MNRICEPKTGLFPEPRDVSFECSCPDWASMCKHVAATLYGVGVRLDQQPELLFLLRGVDQEDLIAKAGTGLRPSASGPARGKVLESGDLAQAFGIEMAELDAPPRTSAARRKANGRVAGVPAPLPPKRVGKQAAPARAEKAVAVVAAGSEPGAPAKTRPANADLGEETRSDRRTGEEVLARAPGAQPREDDGDPGRACRAEADPAQADVSRRSRRRVQTDEALLGGAAQAQPVGAALVCC